MSVCAKCKFLHSTAKSDPWYRWLCMRAPLPQIYNPVTGETVADPPYQFCRYVNKGDCDEFEEGPNVKNPTVETK